MRYTLYINIGNVYKIEYVPPIIILWKW
jgi:hypothetical protein